MVNFGNSVVMTFYIFRKIKLLNEKRLRTFNRYICF